MVLLKEDVIAPPEPHLSCGHTLWNRLGKFLSLVIPSAQQSSPLLQLVILRCALFVQAISEHSDITKTVSFLSLLQLHCSHLL